jgi:hypothetical protein
MSRMTKWFVFTFGFGLLPFGFAVLFHYLHDPNDGVLESSPELLVFTLIVSATETGQLAGTFPAQALRRRFHGAAFAMLLFLAVISAALYGVYVDHGYNTPGQDLGIECRIVQAPSPEALARIGPVIDDLTPPCMRWLAFQDRLFRLSFGMAVFAGVFATLSEWARPKHGD